MSNLFSFRYTSMFIYRPAMSILPKQNVIAILKAALIQCNGYDTLCGKISDAISEFDGVAPEAKVIIRDPVIEDIDNCLSNDKKTKCTKFDKISDALIHGHMYPVIISVNDVCYTFESEAMWDRFRSIIASIYKMDAFKHSVINIYHITPPNAERKARLRYKSVNVAELQLVKKRISEITKSPVDTIDVSELSKKESCITLTDKIGTHKDVSGIITDVCYQLLLKHKDDKPRPFADVQIGDSLCQAELIQVEKKRNGKYDDIVISPITNYYTVNLNVNGDHSIQQVVGQAGGDVTVVTKKKKKQTDEDIAYEWIDANPYDSKKTRGEYHKKYVRYMNKDNKRHLSIIKFACIMKDLDYTEGGTSNHKIWEKVNEKDSEDENEKDESSSDDD